jgi:DDE family transposase
MARSTPNRVQRQVQSQLRQFAQAPGLPFADLLPAAQVKKAAEQEGHCFRDRLYSPWLTLWVFLTQVLDPDPSCRQAVARLLAYLVGRGRPACSPDSGGYCKARGRLPEGLLARLTRDAGHKPLDEASPAWLWKGRRVKVVDGTTVSMPDTPANQKEYPQAPTQKRGLGFPLARLVVVFSLAVGTVLDTALGRYQGKQTGEPALFRQLHEELEPRDVVLADCCYCSYFEIALLHERDVELVLRQHQCRHTDFRRGQRLGPRDHVVTWDKPARPEWMDAATYARLPQQLRVREVEVRVRQKGFRTQRYVVVTTLLDSQEVTAVDLAVLYRCRWQAELYLRSLKVTLQMDVLRCDSPAMVRKEVWAHLLVYNLVRQVMAQAARQEGVRPWEISFTGALQTVRAFLPELWHARGPKRQRLVQEMLRAIGSHEVGDRPDRYEPRQTKRRPKSYPFMTEPRPQARARLAAKT